MSISTDQIRKMYDWGREYDVIGPWLEENGFGPSDLPMVATNEDGESVIVEVYGTDENGNIIWQLTTSQKNGWLRIDVYYKDGTVEELYKR